MKGRIVYIAGPITGRPKEEYMAEFDKWQTVLENDCGMVAINPARILDPLIELTHGEFMVICKAMVDIADVVVMLPEWRESRGARIEYGHAQREGKLIFTADDPIMKPIKALVDEMAKREKIK